MRIWEVGKSKCRVVMMRIQIETLSARKRAHVQLDLIARKFVEPIKVGKANDGNGTTISWCTC